MKRTEIPKAMLTDELRARLFKRSKATESGCLEWVGAATSLGYGRIKVAGKTLLPHRLACAFATGGLDGEGVLDHLCRNPACMNVSHLELVSLAENTARGNNQMARVARAAVSGTHCAAGHLRTPVTWKFVSGSYRCITCRRIAASAYRASAHGREKRAADMRAYRARKKAA